MRHFYYLSFVNIPVHIKVVTDDAGTIVSHRPVIVRTAVVPFCNDIVHNHIVGIAMPFFYPYKEFIVVVNTVKR